MAFPETVGPPYRERVILRFRHHEGAKDIRVKSELGRMLPKTGVPRLYRRKCHQRGGEHQQPDAGKTNDERARPSHTHLLG